MFFFISKYSVKAFWQSSSSSLYIISSCFSRPSTSQTVVTVLMAKIGHGFFKFSINALETFGIIQVIALLS